MALPDALDLVLRLGVLGLVLGGLVRHAVRSRRRRPRALDVTSAPRPLAPAAILARALVAFGALGLFGFALERFTGSGEGLWIPLLVGLPAVGLLWATLVPLLRDVADAVHPHVVVGTVTDRRRRVEPTPGADASVGQTAFFVTVVDDAGAIREYRLDRQAYKRCSRGDQVQVAPAGLRGGVHSVVPVPVTARPDHRVAGRVGAGAAR